MILFPNQNKSKERNFNCSHQVVISIPPWVSVLAALSELLASPGRSWWDWESGERENSGHEKDSSWWEEIAKLDLLNIKPEKLCLHQGCLHSCSIMNNFTWDAGGCTHRCFPHTSLKWRLCSHSFHLIRQFGGVDRALRWASERHGLISAFTINYWGFSVNKHISRAFYMPDHMEG